MRKRAKYRPEPALDTLSDSSRGNHAGRPLGNFRSARSNEDVPHQVARGLEFLKRSHPFHTCAGGGEHRTAILARGHMCLEALHLGGAESAIESVGQQVLE